MTAVVACPNCRHQCYGAAAHCPRCHSDLAMSPCPRCQEQNSRSAILCGQCHIDLRSLKCPKCETLNIEAAARCTKCRCAFTQAGAPTVRHKEEGPANLSVMGVGIGLCLYLVALALSFLPSASLNAVTTHALLSAIFIPVVLGGGIWLTRLRKQIRGADYLLALASGGALGLAAALVLYFVLPRIAIAFGTVLLLPFLIAGAEEAGKLIAIQGFLKRDRYDHETHGLLFGILAGLGFAAVENMGAMLMALHQGESGTLTHLIGLRGLLSLAQACWSGTLASMLWQEKRAAPYWTAPVLWTFLGVTLLHGLWDYEWLYSEAGSETIPAVVLASALATVCLFVFRLRRTLR
jgi:RsiW-degrading membrane proteinase PrsW (M82 family)